MNENSKEYVSKVAARLNKDIAAAKRRYDFKTAHLLEDQLKMWLEIPFLADEKAEKDAAEMAALPEAQPVENVITIAPEVSVRTDKAYSIPTACGEFIISAKGGNAIDKLEIGVKLNESSRYFEIAGLFLPSDSYNGIATAYVHESPYVASVKKAQWRSWSLRNLDAKYVKHRGKTA